LKAVLQLVKEASVTVDNQVVGKIERGFLILLGVSAEDTETDCRYLVDKISNLRVFPDEFGKMNLSIQDVAGQALVVSQFTLYADCRKGRRPNFTAAAPPDKAQELYEKFVALLGEVVPVETGIFQASMEVSLINDGPVTILLESPGKEG